MKAYDCIVVGGGIVGLATAYRLLERRPRWRLLLLEKEPDVARHQTGNNSGVIHAGVYYKPGSLKAQLCVDGGKQLVAFCRKHRVPFEICGKIILATREEQLPRLDDLAGRAKANGLKGAKLIDGREVRKREPNAGGLRALHVPSTGIVDYVATSRALADQVRDRGGEVRCGTSVAAVTSAPGARQAVVRTASEAFTANHVVVCAGLHSDRLAAGHLGRLDVRIVPFRGEYYAVRKERRDIVRALIYPVPDPRFPFVDVHFTRLIDGGLEAGPNAVLALKREGYRKRDISLRDTLDTLAWPGFRKLARKYWRYGLAEMYRSYSKPAFTRALQLLVPDIREQDLETGGAGVRAQACHRDGTLVDDFYLLRRDNVVHVCNAPSPAATASLAIGSYIAKELL